MHSASPISIGASIKVLSALRVIILPHLCATDTSSACQPTHSTNGHVSVSVGSWLASASYHTHTMAASAILVAAGLLCHVVTGAPALDTQTGTNTAPAQHVLAPAPDDHAAPPPSSVPMIQATDYHPTKLHGRFLHITGECVPQLPESTGSSRMRWP